MPMPSYRPPPPPSPRGERVAELFDAHAPAVVRIVARLAGPGAHVEDLVQETFLVAVRKPERVADLDEERAWLYSVAAHLCRQHHRTHGRRLRLAEAVQAAPPGAWPEGPPAADLLAEQRERATRLREAVLELPDEQREVFVLHDLEGVPCPALARASGLGLKTVESRLRLARTKLREALGATRTEADHG